MIKINLLTEKRKKKKRARGPANFLITIAAVSLAALLVAGIATLVFKTSVSRLRAESEADKEKVAGLSKKMDEMKKFEKMNKELEQRSAIIETLKKNQGVPVRVLDEVSREIPEGVWLNSLAFKDNNINVEGFAFTNNDLVAYVENLKRLSDMSDVYLEESREADVEKVKVYKFKLSFKVKV